ncbi:MAG: HRDC domain-containing protein, partial [Actinobacteria bacterium]|nr:HRDC domain-containing protein [Actinomycetota bacterium]
PVLRGFWDDESQRAGVLERCRQLRVAGVEWQQMAVLYRINAQSERWEQTLADAGVPYAVRGEQPYFVRPHVAQAMKVLAAALREGVGDPAFGDELHLLDAAPPEQPRLDRVVDRVLRRRLSWTPDEPPGERAAERWRDLNVLHELAVEAVERDPDVHLRDFVATLRARAEAGHAPDGGGVNLMTIHAAKGLEYDAVFVVDCEEGRVPIRQAIEHDKRLGIGTREVSSAVAEENRLLYVALTRARRHLLVTWVQRGPRRPSRFLYDVGEGAPTRTASSKAATAAKRGKVVVLDDDADMAPDEARVFAALRDWRRERSRRDEVPAFVVFPDATLRDLARRTPSTRVELLGVKGVGPTKAERYGDEVLGVLRASGS